MPNASNSDARKRAAERVGYQSGYCGRCGRTDPTPEPTAASSIDAETLDKWEREAEVVIARRRTTYTGPEMSHRIVVLITALRDEQQAREVAEGAGDEWEEANHHAMQEVRRLREENTNLHASLNAVRAWAANPHGAKSELRKILGDES